MKAAKFYTRLFGKSLCVFLLAIPAFAFGQEDESNAWLPHSFQEPEPWQEQRVKLPAYPEKQYLLDTRINTGGLAYTIYLDPRSLSLGEDSVVRYSVVIESGPGVENVIFEGLHCGNNQYRRYAYGVNGSWRELSDSSWLPITGRGVYRYRRELYRHYICDPSNPVTDVRQILARIRTVWDASQE